MYTRFAAAGPLDSATGADYRLKVLERGGSVDGTEIEPTDVLDGPAASIRAHDVLWFGIRHGKPSLPKHGTRT